MEQKLTNKERRTYEHLCCLTDQGVLQMMNMFLKSRYERVIFTPAYVIALGNMNVGLCAHADTVFSKPPNPNEFYYDQEKNVIWNPDGAGADDRAGIFSIIYILQNYPEFKPTIIITTGEEAFCIGASKLCMHYPTFPHKLKFLIQLDRRGYNDSVYYDCANPDFEAWINKYGFTTAYGSFTDISVLAPHFGCAAVNLSIGYYDEHSTIERLFISYMFNTIHKVVNILKDAEQAPYFEYIKRKSYYTQYPDDGDVVCNTCLKTVEITEALPLYSQELDKHINICLDCYAKYYDRIAWCSQCYKGILFSKTVDQTKPYVCDDCKAQKIQYAGLKKIKK